MHIPCLLIILSAATTTSTTPTSTINSNSAATPHLVLSLVEIEDGDVLLEQKLSTMVRLDVEMKNIEYDFAGHDDRVSGRSLPLISPNWETKDALFNQSPHGAVVVDKRSIPANLTTCVMVRYHSTVGECAIGNNKYDDDVDCSIRNGDGEARWQLVEWKCLHSEEYELSSRADQAAHRTSIVTINMHDIGVGTYRVSGWLDPHGKFLSAPASPPPELPRTTHQVDILHRQAPLLPSTPLNVQIVVVGVFLKHDASFALVVDGNVHVSLELERLEEERYFSHNPCVGANFAGTAVGINDERIEKNTSSFEAILRRGMDAVFAEAHSMSAKDVTHIAFLRGPGEWCYIQARKFLYSYFGVGPGRRVTWVTMDHHVSHAWLGFLSSPFRRPLIATVDGGGNDGNFHVYEGNIAEGSGHSSMQKLREYPENLGVGYTKISAILPEIIGNLDAFDERCVRTTGLYSDLMGCILGLAGKIMGYSGLGAVREEWLEQARLVLVDGWMRVAPPMAMVPVSWLHRIGCDHTASGYCYGDYRAFEPDDLLRRFPDTSPHLNRTVFERDLAATIQHAFETYLGEQLEVFLLHKDNYPDRYDGIVLSGGCALNVLSNSHLERTFGLRVWVPPAPGDGGLALGAAWQVLQPPLDYVGVDSAHMKKDDMPPTSKRRGPGQDRRVRRRQPLQYMGPSLFDKPAVPSLIAAFQRNMSESPAVHRLFYGNNGDGGLDGDSSEAGASNAVGVRLLAERLASGDVIGVARGRGEFGPRALGHRSLLACPVASHRSANMKDVLNRIKFREWWRPVAPIVAVEDALRVFETLPRSPYMTFAPRLRPEAARALPAIAHFDGTARPQIVAAHDEPWLHALLMAVRDQTGWAVLINTSFNVRGKPILNRAAEALELLRESPEMSGVLLEDWLVELTERRTRPVAANAYQILPTSRI